MKRFVLLSWLLAAGAFANNMPAYFKGAVTGELVVSVLTREHFALEPGKITFCKSSDAGSITSFRCEIEAVSATVFQTGGKSLSISLTSLVAFYKTHKGGSYREYNYTGTSPEGPVGLTLWHYNATPKTIRGFIKFDNLGLSVPIVATQP